MRSATFALVGLAAAARVQAHFTLQYPPTVGFSDDIEDQEPCGGFTPDFSNATDFHVGGDAIAVKSTHPHSNWKIRATTDKTASGNWTDLVPTIKQSGLGDFCQPSVPAAESLVGQQGVIQIVQSGDDGSLYQVRTFV
jgi:hypothetical protein